MYHRDNPWSYDGTIDPNQPPIYGPPRPRKGFLGDFSDADLHGNYAGKKHYAYDLYPNPAQSPYAPIDAMDKAARQHDIGYFQENIQWSLFNDDPRRTAIDKDFMLNVNEIDRSNFSFQEAGYHLGINALFGGFFDTYVNPLTDDDYFP